MTDQPIQDCFGTQLHDPSHPVCRGCRVIDHCGKALELRREAHASVSARPDMGEGRLSEPVSVPESPVEAVGLPSPTSDEVRKAGESVIGVLTDIGRPQPLRPGKPHQPVVLLPGQEPGDQDDLLPEWTPDRMDLKEGSKSWTAAFILLSGRRVSRQELVEEVSMIHKSPKPSNAIVAHTMTVLRKVGFKIFVHQLDDKLSVVTPEGRILNEDAREFQGGNPVQ